MHLSVVTYQGAKIESGMCIHFKICVNKSLHKSDSLKPNTGFLTNSKLTSCTVTAFHRNYNLVVSIFGNVPSKLLIAKLSCCKIISNYINMKQVRKVHSIGPLCTYNTKQCVSRVKLGDAHN